MKRFTDLTKSKHAYTLFAFRIRRFAVIKDATPEGYILCLVQYSDYDVSKFNFTNCLKVFMSILEVATSENGLSPGYIFIFDTKGFSFSHFLRLNISGVRKCMKYYQVTLSENFIFIK